VKYIYIYIYLYLKIHMYLYTKYMYLYMNLYIWDTCVWVCWLIYICIQHYPENVKMDGSKYFHMIYSGMRIHLIIIQLHVYIKTKTQIFWYNNSTDLSSRSTWLCTKIYLSLYIPAMFVMLRNRSYSIVCYQEWLNSWKRVHLTWTLTTSLLPVTSLYFAFGISENWPTFVFMSQTWVKQSHYSYLGISKELLKLSAVFWAGRHSFGAE
jgi:hypothetical protein